MQTTQTIQGLIVSVSISTWTGHKLDRTQTNKLTEDTQASPDAARVNKHLVSKESLAGVQQAAGRLRQYFYRAALPWGDNGDRILGAAGFVEFMHRIEELRAEFYAEADHFITVLYPQERARAQFRMGDMFVRSDYPEPEDLRGRFSVRTSMHGVPSGDDFRVALCQEDAEMVRKQIDLENARKLRTAMTTLWTKLFDTVQHFSERMSEGEVFKDATVRNLRALCDELPALNITNDKNIADMCEKIKADLGTVTSKELKKSPAAREAAKEKADKLVRKMESLNKLFSQD